MAGESATVAKVLLDPDDPHRIDVGQLRWRGGLEISHSDKRFGGLSGLHVSEDGGSMRATSDRGWWVSAKLTYEHGDLAGLTALRIAPIRRRGGTSERNGWGDAEAIAADGNGGFYVAFERRHRIAHFAGVGKNPIDTEPSLLAMPETVARQPNNGGIEALARLCDGRLLAISERLVNGVGAKQGWIGKSGAWHEISYRIDEPFRVTGAAALPDCSLLVLERSFSWMTGLRIRIARVPAEALKPGTIARGTEIAEFNLQDTLDNMEGIATRRGDGGETLIYLVSDDNYSAIQRTLLMMFELRVSAAAR